MSFRPSDVGHSPCQFLPWLSSASFRQRLLGYAVRTRPHFRHELARKALRERLRLTFARATGTFDELDLLTIVARSQVGRIRYTGENEQLDQSVPFQSVEEILRSRHGEELFRYLVEKFATFSAISGVQPKILVRDETALDLSAPAEGVLPKATGVLRIS